jgi:hypothetical protein
MQVGDKLMSRTRLGLDQNDIYRVDLRKLLGFMATPDATPGQIRPLENWNILSQGSAADATVVVKLEDANVVYRSEVDDTVTLKAQIPSIGDFGLSQEQRAVVTVKQCGVVFTSAPISWETVKSIIPEGYEGADHLRWIKGASLWTVTIDIFSSHGVSVGLPWFLKSGDKTYKNEDTQNISIITVDAPKLFEFGMGRIAGMVRDNADLTKLSLAELNKRASATGVVSAQGAPPAAPRTMSAPASFLSLIQAPAYPG